ncbi:hypothetical protein BVG19_g1176 [[Candida] boidinii]|nr:hypothetical protein BVG19_g1176 [[Candida] boidinii]OWB52319.1 hypothetical protein B5S27_g3893 [[Candida] boidinii]
MSSSRLEARLRRLFKIPKKGETYEFRSGLVSQYADERKDTIQRVIAAMTVGKDVSSLFPDVLKNIATHDLEQKKLVYLYLMNYAKTNPELCILAVNTFVKDTEDPNPLVRALAIRTMGCIRVDRMADYMDIPLKRTLKDDNPYVRKTAVICVAKLYELNPEICIDRGFLTTLMEMIDDSNQMVVANAISALIEIQKSQHAALDFLNSKVLKKLLITLNECTEWGRISILSALAEYKAEDTNEVNHIVDRVSPQLQHENPSVVLSSIKVLINQLDSVSTDQQDAILRRLSSPLVSLLSSPPEVQYVALRNIRIILEKYPQILSRELRVFFIKYNDPLYLKLEKIEIMVRLSNESNALLLLAELREYAMEIDMEVVKRSIQAIGQISLKIDKISKKTVDVLYDLFINRAEYVINQLVIVLQYILRRYNTSYLTTIITIISDLSIDDLEDSEALSSYIWIIGEYCKEIPHLEDRLNTLVSQFLDSEPNVQSSLLTTIVKVNLIKPTPVTQKLLQQILNQATQEIENADVRDKAYIYWRILSTDNETLQKKVVLATPPVLRSTIDNFNPILLKELLAELGNLSSVYYKPASTFDIDTDNIDKNSKLQNRKLEDLQQLAKNEIVGNAIKSENLLDFDDDVEEEIGSVDGFGGESSNSNILDELNDLFSGLSAQPAAPPQQNQNNALFDLLNNGNSASATLSTQENQQKSKPNSELLDLF